MLLIIAMVLTFGIILKAYCISEWNTVAGSLAVITALITTFLSLKIIWRQEDEYEPDVIAYFDLDSRSKIIQLLIKNVGGSSAYDIKLKWIVPLLNYKADLVQVPYIPVLPKNEQVRLFVDESTKRFENAKEENIDLIFKGIISFKHSHNSKKYIENRFEISLEQYRLKLRPITDEQNFYISNLSMNENIKTIAVQLSNFLDNLNQKKE